MKLTSIILAFLLAGLLLAACGGGEEVPPTPTPVDLSRDDLGRSVSLPAAPQSVVALSPTVVELMFAVGATPVGRPSSATYPEAAKAVPSFGESRAPSFEAIAALKPDLIIADALLHQAIVDSLSQQLSVPVFALRVSSVNDVMRGITLVGALTGRRDAAAAAAKALSDKLAAVKAKLPAQGPTVLVLVAAGRNQFIAARSNTYLGDILATLGAKNVVTTEPENFAYPGFTDYSLERIVEKNPDVIIAASVGGPPGTPKTSELLKSVPALASLKAVRENRVYEVDVTVYIQAAGPRLSQILDELPKLLYPDVFAAAP